ncbi:hypothetical protein HPP92_026164 [Vanilla planifolia]|uniref:Peroxiredoxin-like 2A n=1 Tax=Vanilla planifolia TaxID=51239 RepID=A0A835PGL2_VANPL|nr:hypothetical protein HPP92_026164 [Vanilla planifolia]
MLYSTNVPSQGYFKSLSSVVLNHKVVTDLHKGWHDVPTLKIVTAEDLDLLKLTQQQKDALELRKYLHDRSLMQYADKMEDAGLTVSKLLKMRAIALSSQFSMRRAHVAIVFKRESTNSSTTNVDQELKFKEGHVFKGIVAGKTTGHHLCSCFDPSPILDDVAPYPSLANISIRKLTTEYKACVECQLATKAPLLKASELWNEKPTVLLCIRRPGCIICRAEAHRLYSRKPVFDALGFQLVVVLHELIESQVKEFWPRYWGGMVVIDQSMGFFKALGSGKLLKERFLTDIVLNSRANYKAAKASGFKGNHIGEGEIKGGLFVIRRGRGGVAYQFIERKLGDWAPIVEVIEICSRVQNES